MAEVLHLDFETYSEADLKNIGAWAYSKHPTTEVICMAYTIDDSLPVLLKDTADITEFLLRSFEKKRRFKAWNSFFELAICVNVLGIDEAKNIDFWEDTAAAAATLALPRSLGQCGAAIGLEQDMQKDKRGSYLIQRLCKLYRGKRVRDPELLNELYEYCKQDVVAEREIQKRLRPLTQNERRVWQLDQKINLRGIHIDSELVDSAIDVIAQVNETLNKEVAEITNGELINVSQRVKVMSYISSLGYELKGYNKASLTKALSDKNLPPIARRLVEIRRQTGKTSTAKYASLKKIKTEESKAHGLLMYHGASTGRWTGRLFQPQNLPRSSFDDIDTCIEVIKTRDAELLTAIYDDPMEALSSCVRGVICASKGKRLIVSDYSAIEARVLPWLSGQEDVLDVFRSHGKIYEHTASQIYNKHIDGVTKDERFIGKVATLALGYQGGAKAFQGMAEIYGAEIDEDQADRIKTDWRDANHKTVRYWWDCDKAAVKAVQNPGKTFTVRSVAFRVVAGFLFCKLPSGRLLAYYQPRIAIGKFDNPQVTFMGINTITRKWERLDTYGGKLVENITQAVARDIIVSAMFLVEEHGYELISSVHDELIAEVDEDFGSVEEFEQLMCVLPPWASGLPIAAEGFESKRYRK